MGRPESGGGAKCFQPTMVLPQFLLISPHVENATPPKQFGSKRERAQPHGRPSSPCFFCGAKKRPIRFLDSKKRRGMDENVYGFTQNPASFPTIPINPWALPVKLRETWGKNFALRLNSLPTHRGSVVDPDKSVFLNTGQIPWACGVPDPRCFACWEPPSGTFLSPQN